MFYVGLGVGLFIGTLLKGKKRTSWEKDGLCAVEYYLKPYAFWDRRQDGDST